MQSNSNRMFFLLESLEIINRCSEIYYVLVTFAQFNGNNITIVLDVTRIKSKNGERLIEMISRNGSG